MGLGLGIRNWWSRVRDQIHGLEDETELAKRLAHTPPEFLSGRDHSEAARLRHRSRATFEKAILQGKSKEEAQLIRYTQFPPGPFWPRTPRVNTRMRDNWTAYRMIVGAAEILGVPDLDYLDFVTDDNGAPWAFDIENPRVKVRLSDFMVSLWPC